MALPRGNSKTGPGKTLRLHFPLTHHRGLRRGHTAKVEVLVKEGSLGASDILSDRPRLTLTSTLVIDVLSSACAATAALQSAALLGRDRTAHRWRRAMSPAAAADTHRHIGRWTGASPQPRAVGLHPPVRIRGRRCHAKRCHLGEPFTHGALELT